MAGEGGLRHQNEEEGRSPKPPPPSSPACSQATPCRRAVAGLADSALSALLDVRGQTPRGGPKAEPPPPPRERDLQGADDKKAAGGVGAWKTASCCSVVVGGGGEPSVTTTGCTENEESFVTASVGGHEHRHAGGVTEAAMGAFRDAMDLIGPVEKAEWALAQGACPPSVLEHECCPCHFVAACEGNPWDAAARACSYWKERISLFEDRAFEALTLGSDVASPTGLTKDDVRVLETGVLSVLPCDREGKSVLFCDFTLQKFGTAHHIKSLLRVLWYVMQAAYTSGDSQCHRMVFMIACYRPPMGGQYASAVWRFSSECRKIPSALPIALDCLHLLTLSSRTGNDGLIRYVLAATIEMAGAHLSSFMRVHHGAANKGTTDAAQADLEAKQSLVQQLRDLGFTKKGLPDWAGGAFTMDDFYVWVRRRRRIEQRLFWTAEQRAQQKREVNRIHSREKRMRRHHEFKVLKEQVDELEWRNQQARITQHTLERLLEEANVLVDTWKEGCLPGEVYDQRPSTGAGWTFEPFHEPGVSAEPLPLEVHPALEPDPIAPYCIPSEAEPDIPSSLPSWTDAVRTYLEEPTAVRDVAGAALSVQRHSEEAGEAQGHNSNDATTFPLSPDPLREYLNSASALAADPRRYANPGCLPDRIDTTWAATASQQLQLTVPDRLVMLPPPRRHLESTSQADPFRTSGDISAPMCSNQDMTKPILDDDLRLPHTEGTQTAPPFHPHLKLTQFGGSDTLALHQTEHDGRAEPRR